MERSRKFTLWAAAGIGAALLVPLLRTETRAGHEYRQDDWPSLAAAPDGSLWLSWLSYNGEEDEIGLRRFRDGKWEALQWAPGSAGDNWMPQTGVDASGRVWIVWARQESGNWDLVARWFDPARQFWGPLERLTSDPLPDTNPRLAVREGRFALVWQGWRAGDSRILMRRFDGDRWSPEIAVSVKGGNDWDPAVALDSAGRAWVAFDTYRNGNYDVFLARVDGERPGDPVAVAASPRFEARATVAVDGNDRPWVAWEAGPVNWGKDQGYIIRDRQTGALLDGERHVRLRCYENGRWLEPPAPSVLETGKTNQPHIFSDGRGSVWLAVKNRFDQKPPGPSLDGYMPHYQRGYWEYSIAHLAGGAWSARQVLPNSRGRLSTRMTAVPLPDGRLAAAWPADVRVEGQWNRPLRQQVLAEIVAAPPRTASPELGPAREEAVQPLAGHRDEPGDIRALHEHRTKWNGKELRIVRGDFHRHTELSWDVGGGFDGSLQDFYRYMIDAARMDFGASTDHQGRVVAVLVVVLAEADRYVQRPRQVHCGVRV